MVRVCPIVDISAGKRYPVLGARYQPRAGIAKHDHVAWAYARAADALGADLIEGCEVTGIDTIDGRAMGVRTTRGPIAAGSIAIVAAHSSRYRFGHGISLLASWEKSRIYLRSVYCPLYIAWLN